MTSNLPDFISLSSLCLFLCLDFYLFSFLFCTFDSLNSFNCDLIESFSFLSFIFSSQDKVAPLFLQLRLGALLAPTFHDLLLLFMPIVYFSSVSFCSPGWGNASQSINNAILSNKLLYSQFQQNYFGNTKQSSLQVLKYHSDIQNSNKQKKITLQTSRTFAYFHNFLID